MPLPLEDIRKRPTMYLGERSLSGLWHFLNGYSLAVGSHGLVQPDWMPPRDFHDWVAYRLHFKESTRGYRNMILARAPDEAAAFDKFFELLDGYRQRSQREVAKVPNYNRDYTTIKVVEGNTQPERTEHFPSTLKLITFTDDPGFFVVSEPTQDPFPGAGFYPSLGWFRQRFKLRSDEIVVIDGAIYERLVAEESKLH